MRKFLVSYHKQTTVNVAILAALEGFFLCVWIFVVVAVILVVLNIFVSI